MAYQLSDLITAVRNRAKDTTFDSDLITDYLQATQNKVLNRSRFRFMEEVDTDTLAISSTDYELADDVDTILSLVLIDADDNVVRPEYLGYAEFYETYDPETSQAATPVHYTVFGSTIMFQAPTVEAYTIKVKYLKTPSILSLDTDVPDIPERFKELLIAGALARVEEYRGNYDIAALHDRRVEELTEDMLVRTSLRQLATPHKARFGRR